MRKYENSSSANSQSEWLVLLIVIIYYTIIMVLVLVGLFTAWMASIGVIFTILIYFMTRFDNLINKRKFELIEICKETKYKEIFKLLILDLEDTDNFRDYGVIMTIVSTVIALFLAELIKNLVIIEGFSFSLFVSALVSIGILTFLLIEISISALNDIIKMWNMRQIIVECINKRSREHEFDELLLKYYKYDGKLDIRKQ